MIPMVAAHSHNSPSVIEDWCFYDILRYNRGVQLLRSASLGDNLISGQAAQHGGKSLESLQAIQRSLEQ